jgi:hypothetical protein
VAEKWVYLYLRDGEEIVKLSRTRNESAQIYVDMSLRDVMLERVTNYILSSTSCCHVENGGMSTCEMHTPELIEQEVEARLSAVISDEEWPSVLEARKIEAREAQEYLEQKARERQLAQECGEGEWRRVSGCWKVWTLREPKRGDTTIVRTKYGETKKVIIDSSYETESGWLSETHPAPVGTAPAPVFVMQRTA